MFHLVVGGGRSGRSAPRVRVDLLQIHDVSHVAPQCFRNCSGRSATRGPAVFVRTRLAASKVEENLARPGLPFVAMSFASDGIFSVPLRHAVAMDNTRRIAAMRACGPGRFRSVAAQIDPYRAANRVEGPVFSAATATQNLETDFEHRGRQSRVSLPPDHLVAQQRVPVLQAASRSK